MLEQVLRIGWGRLFRTRAANPVEHLFPLRANPLKATASHEPQQRQFLKTLRLSVSAVKYHRDIPPELWLGVPGPHRDRSPFEAAAA